MGDVIFLRDLKTETIIGIYDWERKIRQTLSFDFEFPGDIRRMWRHHWVDFDILLADHGIQQYCELLQRKWGAPYAG